MGRQDAESETLIPIVGGGFDDAPDIECVTGSVTHTLTAEGFDASEDGTGRGNPIVPVVHGSQDPCTTTTSEAGFTVGRNGGLENCIAFSAKDYGGDATDDLSPTLRSGNHTDSHANGGVMPAVAYGFQPRIGRNGRGDMGDIVNALTAQAGETGKGDAAPCVAYAIQERAICENPDAEPDGVGALAAEPGAQQQTYVAADMAVRRLLPVETERLQGFPDGWTRIPVRFYRERKVTKTRPADMWEPGDGGWWLMAADGPRYKQCGNSMARNVMAWIGGRIKNWLELEPFRELIG